MRRATGVSASARWFRRRRSSPVPKPEELQFKPKTAWRMVGKDTSTYDQKDIVTGKAQFGLDVYPRRHGLRRRSSIRRCSAARPKSVDDKAALAVKGVQQTVALDTFKPPHLFQPLGGVAVIADSTWAALKGRQGAEGRMERRRARRVRVRGLQAADARDGEADGQGLPQSRERRRRVRARGGKVHRGDVLHADGGARVDGAAGGGRRIQQRQGRRSGRRRRIRRRCRTPWPRRSASRRKTSSAT